MNPKINIEGKKLCVVMAYTGNVDFIKMGDYSSLVNMEYCRQHGYGFRLYTEGFADDRHPSWSKILFVQDTLESYPWVVWMDADAIVTNPSIMVEKYIDDRFMLIGGKQKYGGENAINFGVFLIRNDPDVKSFFKMVWDDVLHSERTAWEQDVVREVITTEPYKSKTNLVRRREFNSVVYHPAQGPVDEFDIEDEVWRNGDFIAHYGLRYPNILEAMKEARQSISVCKWY